MSSPAKHPVLLWLDDVRPAPEGWLHVRTAAEARRVLSTTPVTHASLDHDLGCCEPCQFERGCTFRPCEDCNCHETGYDLAQWMAEKDIWPTIKPRVHSANPAGAARMRMVIDRYWHAPTETAKKEK